MIKTGLVWRKMAAAMTVFVMAATAGCGDDVDDKPLATVPLRDMETQVRQHAADVVADVMALPPEAGVLSVPCDDPIKDLADDGRYYVSGHWQILLPSDRQRATFQRLRDNWQAKGYDFAEYRELSDGVSVVMIAQDPNNGFSVTLTTTEPPDAVAMNVTSPCVMSPNGKYPPA